MIFSARQHSIHICIARYVLSPVRLSVRQTGGSYKNGGSCIELGLIIIMIIRIWNFHHTADSSL